MKPPFGYSNHPLVWAIGENKVLFIYILIKRSSIICDPDSAAVRTFSYASVNVHFHHKIRSSGKRYFGGDVSPSLPLLSDPSIS